MVATIARSKRRRYTSRTKTCANPIEEAERLKAKAMRMYFNAATHAAIVKFQQLDDAREREKLYRAEILPAFEKLVENLINIHKFTGLHDSFTDLKHDCVNFLFETLRKFDPLRGSNAFSYFNVVAKNWLIIKTKQKSLRLKRLVSMDDMTSLTPSDQQLIEEHHMVPSQDDLLDKLLFNSNVLEVLYDVRSVVKTENELICINSIITIFENIDDLDLLNKGAILLYMRELTGLTAKQTTVAMQQIKKNYKTCKAQQLLDQNDSDECEFTDYSEEDVEDVEIDTIEELDEHDTER